MNTIKQESSDAGRPSGEAGGETTLRELGNRGSNKNSQAQFGKAKQENLDGRLNVDGEDDQLADDGLEFRNDDPILANTRENDNMR